jgi:hypothetical protein
MTPQELKTRYDAIYNIMRASQDVEKMRVFGEGVTKMFNQIAHTAPNIAAMALEYWVAIEYDNYVTASEANEIASHFVNDDTKVSGATEPSKGVHWDMDTLKSFLLQKGLPLEDKPHYNWPALWLAVNMEYSDYANAFVALTGKRDNDTMATASYTFAVKKLKDPDRPHFIREYFDLDE